MQHYPLGFAPDAHALASTLGYPFHDRCRHRYEGSVAMSRYTMRGDGSGPALWVGRDMISRQYVAVRDTFADAQTAQDTQLT